MLTRLLAGSLLIAAALAGAAQAPAPGSPFTGPFVDLAAPPPARATVPNLAVDARGRVWLGWLEPREGGGHRFRLSSLDAGTRGAAPAWSAPVTLAEGPNLLANWADFPSVFVAADGTMAAHWLERGQTRGEYGIRLRTSADGGRTWTAPVTPHRDPPAAAEHGFVSFFDAPGAGLGLIWLDGRDMAGGHGSPQGHGSMALRSALVSNGVAGPEMLVDPKVCECCQTSAARTADGVIVAYRDRSDGEIRDIAVSRFKNGAWFAPAIVHADDWQINGCPVNGPSVAAVGKDVAVAWYAAKGGEPKLQVAFSRNGAPFSAPVRANSAVTYGRLALVLAAADRAIVSSIERGESGAELVVREVRRDGRLSAPVVVGPMTADRSSGFARMVLAGRRLVIAWTHVRAGAPPAIQVRAVEVR